MSALQEAMREFEALDMVQQLPTENFGKNASIMLIQYLLDSDIFVYCVNQLMTNETYLMECYDKTSTLNNAKLADELLGVFSLLNQFDFRLGLDKNPYSTTSYGSYGSPANDSPLMATSSQFSMMNHATRNSLDMISLHPILQLKQSITAIVQFFYVKKNEEKLDLNDIGNDSKHRELDSLIRKKLCFALMDIFLKGFKSFSIFKNYHIWNVIEEASRLKKCKFEYLMSLIQYFSFCCGYWRYWNSFCCGNC